MASAKDTATFFQNGTVQQFENVLKLYPQALRVKAEQKAKKPEELIKLDNWYQTELPKKIRSRGKDAHLVHEELVQCMKWKQARGKFYPQLNYLIKVNTPRAVMQETKKAFKKLPNLEQAITALSNLKGVGTTMASALLAAASPESAPFMADECLMAIPEIEGIDYTTKEYLKFVQHIQQVVDRLNASAPAKKWSPHKVELAVWTHFILTDLKPELLQHCNGDGPISVDDVATTANGKVQQNGGGDSGVGTIETSDESNQEPLNEDSLDKAPSSPSANPVVSSDAGDDETNDSLISDSTINEDSSTRNSSSMNAYSSSAAISNSLKRPHDLDDDDSLINNEAVASSTKSTAASSLLLESDNAMAGDELVGTNSRNDELASSTTTTTCKKPKMDNMLVTSSTNSNSNINLVIDSDNSLVDTTTPIGSSTTNVTGSTTTPATSSTAPQSTPQVTAVEAK